MNIPPAAATDEPAVLPTSAAPARSLARVSERLAEDLIEPALDAGRDVRGRATRRDGWTPERIRIFLESLAECGVVEDAARAAGMSKQSAYRLRNRASGRAFHLAWAGAEHLSRRRVASELLSRALHGCVEVITRDGEVWGERHRFDNRLTMAVLTRLDRKVATSDAEDRTARLVAQEFDQFLDIVCSGDDNAAARFLHSRIEADSWNAAPEAYAVERCGNYARYGVGLPEEIPIADLGPAGRGSWTAEQHERAFRSGVTDTESVKGVPGFLPGLLAGAGPAAASADPSVAERAAEPDPPAPTVEHLAGREATA